MIRRYKKSYPVLKFCQGEINKDYLFHLYKIFEAFVATPPKRIAFRREGKEYVQYMFQTLSFEVYIVHKS